MCIFWHKWGKWEQYELSVPASQVTKNMYIPAYVEIRQERVCTVCNKMQDKYVKIY